MISQMQDRAKRRPGTAAVGVIREVRPDHGWERRENIRALSPIMRGNCTEKRNLIWCVPTIAVYYGRESEIFEDK